MERFAIPGVAGIIEGKINNKDCILVQKRCKNSSSDEFGLLEIPAGKIREFENVFSCLRREIKEETGLNVSEITGENESVLIERGGYKVVNYQPFACSQNTEGDYPIMVQVFICKANGNLLNSSSESEEIKWMELDELEKELDTNQSNFYPMHINTLKKFISSKNSFKR